MKYKKVET